MSAQQADPELLASLAIARDHRPAAPQSDGSADRADRPGRIEPAEDGQRRCRGFARTAQAVDIEDLADLVNVSVSTFHRQLKAVTSMSPLQYQKTLRLQEARRLMLTTILDAGSAARRVGYVSASQFSREYARFFGTAPTK